MLLIFAFNKLSKKWRLLLVAICTMLFLVFGAASKLGNIPKAIGITPSLRIAQTEPTNTQTNAAVYHFKIGKFNAMTVSDGNFMISLSSFVPNAELAEIKKSLYESFLPTGSDYLFYVNTLYLDTGEHKILIDSGAGRYFGNTAGYLAQNLTSAGIDPDSIDMVLITHAHTDHIGGLISADGTLTYINTNRSLEVIEYDTQRDFFLSATEAKAYGLIDEIVTKPPA